MFTMQTLFKVIAIALLIVSLSQARDDNKFDGYIKTDSCKENNLCAYDYSVEVELSNGEGIVVSANVKTVCDSVGFFRGKSAKLHCISVSNVVAMVTNVTEEEDGSGYSDDKTRRYGSDMSKWFCFAQSTTGKILGVFHPKNEENEIVNFKKSIAAAFQANFKGTSEEDEGDSQTFHRSHYKYYSENNRLVQQRTVDENDVIKYAGNSKVPTRKSLHFHQEDKIEIDERKTVYFSTGKTTIDLRGKAEPDKDEESRGNMFNSSYDVPSLGASTSYKLSLSRCEDISSDGSRRARSLYQVTSQRDGIVDDILAKRDQAKEDQMMMKELHDDLPSLDEIVTRAVRDTETDSTEKLLRKLRHLLELEAKNGPFPGTQPKLPELIRKLKETFTRGYDASEVRQVLYDLLNSEGSLEAQKALVEMLHHPLKEEERMTLLLQIALLSSVHPSTLEYLQNYLKLSDDTNQLILSFATLGRHSNVEDSIVNTLSKELEKSIKTYQITNNSSPVVHIIHALGNTGSKKMIPLLLPFLSSDQHSLQLPTIDALRTVSRDEEVQDAFIHLVNISAHIEPVIEIVESLLFPFKQSIYFTDHPEDAGKSSTEKALMKVLVNAAIKFRNVDLNKVIKIYLNFIDTPEAQELLIKLQAVVGRSKRASTTNWNSGYSKYNLIASRSSRTSDEINYPYHRAYLWAHQFGVNKLHAKVAAGGFSGVGLSGYKLFGRGVLELYAWGYTYRAFDVKSLNQQKNSSSTRIIKYGRICGITYINDDSIYGFPYSYPKSWKLKSLTLFDRTFSFFIYIGTLDLTISGGLSGDLNFMFYANSTHASSSFFISPTVTVTGSASVTVLFIYRIGLDVSASFQYSIGPRNTATLCDTSPIGDATVCLHLYTKQRGSINIYAYYRIWECSLCWYGPCKCKWGSKKKVSALSYRKSLFTSSFWGDCLVCNCPGELGYFCDNQYGNPPGVSGCSCYSKKSY